MPPKVKKTGNANGDGAGDDGPFNEKDLKFIKAILDNTDGRPNCDWAKVAPAAGVKDAKQAGEKFRVMSIKFGWQGKPVPANPADPTAVDARFIKALFDNMDGRPNANWDQVAVDYGSKDKKQAMEKYRVMSIKFGWSRDAGGASNPAAAAKKSKGKAAAPAASRSSARTPKKRSLTAANSEDDLEEPDQDDVIVAKTTSEPAPKRARTTKKTVHYADSDDDGDSDSDNAHESITVKESDAKLCRSTTLKPRGKAPLKKAKSTSLNGPLFPNLRRDAKSSASALEDEEAETEVEQAASPLDDEEAETELEQSPAGSVLPSVEDNDN